MVAKGITALISWSLASSTARAQDMFLASATVKHAERATCRIKSHTDVAVTHYRRISATTADECCAACVADSKCQAAVFKVDHCSLKDSLELVNSTSEFVTILPDYHPSPPSPPTPPSPPPSPPPGTKIPCIPLKNAALPLTCYPMTGLGIRGPGYKLGQSQECWRYPACCTKDYCPAINATRDWLKLGGWRIDTGYPFGDSGGSETGVGKTCGGMSPPPGQLGGHLCDPHGTREGIMQSGVPRENLFITIKSGSSGPMQEVDQGDRQAENMLYWLGIKYADLYLMHEGDLGTTGHHPSAFCDYPTTAACRIRVFQSCIRWMAKGKTRACGVANWELEWLQELKAANVTLPAVAQMKFHLHQSFESPRIKAIKAFCDDNGILFNGYSPLGRADWTVFNSSVGTPTTLQEPVVLEIAKKVGRSPAQVILRWHVQQGISTQPRSMNPAHMKENLDVFEWHLSDEDMSKLSSMPQCTTIRGDPFMPGDPEYHGHENMIGPTKTC